VQETIEGLLVLRSRTRGVVLNTPLDPAVGELLRGLPADVVHIHYPPPVTPYFAARALRHHGPPILLTYHCDLYLPGFGGRVLTAMYERIFLYGLLNRVDRIVVHTRGYGNTSAMLRGRAVEVIPSLVDVERFRHPADVDALRASLGLTGRRVLTFTGRLVASKGVDTLLRALPLFPADVTLLVIGSGPRLTDLQSLARRVGVTSRVQFLTDVSYEDLPRYLALSDVFVFPSQNRLEGFGLAAAEAMASGLPVVVADMPGVREVIEPGREGLLADPVIAADFARPVLELLNDPARRKQMGEAGRKRADELFTLQKVTSEIERVYRELSAAPR
jgi:glycosyltransferase involved in cell wall biosynthesis